MSTGQGIAVAAVVLVGGALYHLGHVWVGGFMVGFGSMAALS